MELRTKKHLFQRALLIASGVVVLGYISNLLSVGKCESVVATRIAVDIGHLNVFVLPGTSTYAENRLKRAGFVTRKCHKNED